MTAVPGYRDAPIDPWHPDASVDIAEAEEFLRACHAELPTLGPVEPRLAAVREQVDAVGTYAHTPAELVHGARMAWRNSSRCIGRLYWRSLVVLDRRVARTPDEIFDHLVAHLEVANGRCRAPASGGHPPVGRLRPVISVFGQAVPGRPVTRVWNDQLIRYAGHRAEDGTVLGDPRYVEFTEAVTALGWRGKGDAFDVLPLVLDMPGAGPRVYELPESSVLEVPLVHPEHRWFAELGLRWYAVPAIANMRLSIGGVNYPLAPFSGWYLGTEVGSRNLADAGRYNMLPVLAERLGLDTSTERTLWRDRALVELNRAVLWSYEQAGVRIADHHTESHRFLNHVAREERAGRPTPADWTWIVPPLSGAATAVFHRYYHEADLRPNFYLDNDARDLASRGRPGGAAPPTAAPIAGPRPVPNGRPEPSGPGAKANGLGVGGAVASGSRANGAGVSGLRVTPAELPAAVPQPRTGAAEDRSAAVCPVAGATLVPPAATQAGVSAGPEAVPAGSEAVSAGSAPEQRRRWLRPGRRTGDAAQTA